MKQIFNTVGTQEQELCITRCLESSGEFNSWIIPLSAFNNCQCLKQWILCNGWRKIGTILSCKSLEKNILPPLPPSCYKLLGTLLLKIARGLSDLAMPQDALNNIMASSFTSLCNIKTFLSHTLSMAFMSCIGLINIPDSIWQWKKKGYLCTLVLECQKNRQASQWSLSVSFAMCKGMKNSGDLSLHVKWPLVKGNTPHCVDIIRKGSFKDCNYHWWK